MPRSMPDVWKDELGTLFLFKAGLTADGREPGEVPSEQRDLERSIAVLSPRRLDVLRQACA